MAGTVDVGGTVTTMETEALFEGECVRESDIPGTRYNARTGITQDDNFYQELTDFIGEVGRTHGMAYGAVIATLEKMLASMRTDRSS